MTTILRKLREWWRKTFSLYTTPIGDAISVEYKVWRDRFLWQRLHLWLWVALICVLTFTSRYIYGFFFPLNEFEQLPPVLRTQGLVINVAILLCLLVCFTLRKTKFGRLHAGILFLASSWSISLVQQIFGTLNGIALPATLTWSLLFLSQATFMPVRWLVHLTSQLGVLIYYFGVNTALKLQPPPLFTNQPNLPIYNVTFILYIFWLCVVCDFGVYLYDRLQAKEFYARKELETAYQKLGVAEAKYRSIFENAVEGIFQSTAEGRFITANPALASICGYSLPEEVTAHFTDIEHQLYVDPNRRAEFVRLIEQHGSVSGFESQIYRQDGSIVWISEKAYAVRDERGKLLYYEGMIEDITQRKRAEDALLVFFHAVSHDLRNPVLGTLMVVKNLLHRGVGSGEWGVGKESAQALIPVPRSILERMLLSCDRQLNLINSLMEAHVSEVQGIIVQCQPVELHTVVEAAIADLEPIIAENQAILTNLVTADLPIVNADHTQLWRVFSNLIVNAVKHNSPGLSITINASVKGDKIYCTVSDNGVGINPEQCDRLFDLYFRGDNLRNSVSLGLGLYLCKQIITAHSGEIGVKSTPGSGATFWFTLPIHRQEEAGGRGQGEKPMHK